MKNRITFETWATTHDMDLTPTPIACYSGIYSDCNTDYAWLAWQAAIAHERERCATEVKAEPELEDEMPDEMFEYMTRGRAEMSEALRAVVRATKGEILERINYPQIEPDCPVRSPVQAPAWHDAPDAPGLWLNGINLQAERVTPHHIEFSSWKNTGAKWYGPIPSEDKP